MKNGLISATFALLATFSVSQAHAVLIGGVELPDGAVSFVDEVVSYSPGPDVGVGGGYDDPDAALGTPDWSGANNTAVSLGNYGELVLKFTDNSLTTSGNDDADLWIWEIGGAVEWFNVAISEDNITWIDLGDVLGQPTGIDIDAVAGVSDGDMYTYVRLTDISPEQSGSPYGEADIDAVAAISSAAPVSVPVPEPSTVMLLSLGLLGLRYSRKLSA